MADAQNFLDNLKNLRMVMSVALEHAQENRNQFVKNATRRDVGQFERFVSDIRTLAEQVEREFRTLDDLIQLEAARTEQERRNSAQEHNSSQGTRAPPLLT